MYTAFLPSLMTISLVCVVGAFARKGLDAPSMTVNETIVYAVLTAFVAMMLVMLFNAIGLNYGLLDDVGFSILYLAMVRPRNLIGRRSGD